jgi:hypothetical protein
MKYSQNSRNQGFSYFFCLIMEGSGSVHIMTDPNGPKTYGFGSPIHYRYTFNFTAILISSFYFNSSVRVYPDATNSGRNERKNISKFCEAECSRRSLKSTEHCYDFGCIQFFFLNNVSWAVKACSCIRIRIPGSSLDFLFPTSCLLKFFITHKKLSICPKQCCVSASGFDLCL